MESFYLKDTHREKYFQRNFKYTQKVQMLKYSKSMYENVISWI